MRSCFHGVSLMHSLSKNFFSLEKENEESKCIHDVKSASGTLPMGDGEIRRRPISFFAQLYESESSPSTGNLEQEKKHTHT